MLLLTVTQIVKVLSSILNTAMEIPLSTSKKYGIPILRRTVSRTISPTGQSRRLITARFGVRIPGGPFTGYTRLSQQFV